MKRCEMDQFNPLIIDHLIELAFEEDIGPGDVTTGFLPDPRTPGRGKILAKSDLVIAGLAIVRRVFEKLDSRAVFSSDYRDGDRVKAGTVIAEVSGEMAALLTGERTGLNFLQRLSGIATHVRKYSEAVKDNAVRLVDTRKTIPGWRMLEKYAVRIGGAHNHRMGLYDGVLIKDNHIAAFGGIRPAVEAIRGRVSHLLKIEVETATLDEVRQALDAGADVIMLDNMDPDLIRSAVKMVNGRCPVEVSGRVKPEDLSRLAGTGIDIISAGGMTHGAVFVDISMKIKPLQI